MLNKSLMVALMGGIIGLASPAFAQDTVSGTHVTNVTTDRVVVTHDVVVSNRVVLPTATGNPRWEHAISGGGAGGAIGGYYINGTTPADNRPLPGGAWPWPYR